MFSTLVTLGEYIALEFEEDGTPEQEVLSNRSEYSTVVLRITLINCPL